MKAYIHAFRGKPYNDDCAVAYDGFRKLGVETVLFTTNEEFDTRKPEDVVVGGTIMIWNALNERGIESGHHDYPPELADFRGRNIRKIKLKDIQKETLPVFIKPVEEKTAPGIVLNTWADLEDYKNQDPDSEIYCSEVVNFISEWRCFVLYGEILDIRFYYGDRNAECDRSVIDAAVQAYTSKPAGCAVDFGVTDDGRTLLLEVNDGFSLGTYGLEDTLYAKLLTARWAELNGTEDIFKTS